MVRSLLTGELHTLRARLAEAHAANAALAHTVWELRVAALKDADTIAALRTLTGHIAEPQFEGGRVERGDAR